MATKRKPSASVEHRLTKLEQETKTLFHQLREQAASTEKKIDDIKEYVSENLGNSLDEAKTNLKTLLDRKQSYDAVRSFLNNCAKLAITLAGFTWSVLQVIKFFRHA